MSTLSDLKNGINHWYLPLIVGIIFIALGVYVYTVPLETYVTLAMIFSVSFIVSGIAEIVFSLSNKNQIKGWGWYFVGGLLSLIIGVYMVMYPGIPLSTLPYFVGFTMLFRSIQGLGISFDLKSYGIISWGNLALISVLGIITSFILLANPLFTGISIVVMTAITLIVFGIYSSVFAFKVKKIKDKLF